MTTTSRLRTATAALLLLSLAATACNDGATAEDPAAAPTPAAPAEPAPLAPIAVDWSGPTVAPTTLTNGWLLAACQGEAPALCVTDGGDLVGTIESGRWKPDDPVTDADAFLRSQLDDFLATFGADRAVACGDGYRFELDGLATTVTVGGQPGLTYATHGVAANGDVHERGLATTIVDGDEVVWISAVATATDGCMAADLQSEFTPDDLETFAPVFEALIRGTSFAGGPLADGDHQGRVRFDGDVLVVDTVRVLSGEEARQAAVDVGLIAAGEDLPNDVFIDEGDATTWRVPLATDTTAAVYDCSAACELVDVAVADLSVEVTAFNGDAAVFDLTVVDGRVTSIAEIYLP